jgi:hypothetical protein
MPNAPRSTNGGLAFAAPEVGDHARANLGAKFVLSLMFVWFSYRRPALNKRLGLIRQSSVAKKL